MLPAARVTDLITSPATTGAPTPIIPPGAPTVLIGGLPAARLGDSCGADAIIKGSATVFIGGLPAARVADATASGGAVLPPGCLTVLIGG
ncbi:PAAR domain-containing protein [Hymenobacter sp. BT664]|uniref:PAAR domain-containing protein n=1 Tax=Hymenobacter montanus TaxID=2771359 RepID=A0A927BA51_9BACT|nr:PAAR domain-containing protein [Hymenobacter montanus]MBD2766352.1 PAAR domain-containing protein [Hymenobacter montanus]